MEGGKKGLKNTFRYGKCVRDERLSIGCMYTDGRRFIYSLFESRPLGLNM